MSEILDHLADRVLLCDGGMGTQVQSMNLSAEVDYQGHENCTVILCLSRPDVVREIHSRYFAAGADMDQSERAFGVERNAQGMDEGLRAGVGKIGRVDDGT